MPHTIHHPPARKAQKRNRKPKPLVAAAVSMPPDLYSAALGVADRIKDGNFSAYMRDLIRADLSRYPSPEA